MAKLARWLVEEGIVKGADPARAERAARLAKADLVTGMVGEFPELQGLMGGYYAAAQGDDAAVAEAIRDHYKPIGQGDDVPTAPVTVAVSLADKLDTILAFFLIDERPTGSKDPFALRRSALGVIGLTGKNGVKLPLSRLFATWTDHVHFASKTIMSTHGRQVMTQQRAREQVEAVARSMETETVGEWILPQPVSVSVDLPENAEVQARLEMATGLWQSVEGFDPASVLAFLIDRLKVQQREAGVRHDLIDAVFALGGEDDLVRLLARVHALQAFMATDDGANLLAGYKRAANILKKEGVTDAVWSAPAYAPEPAEAALIAALDGAEPKAAAAVEGERFEEAMAALATLRAPIDAFFTDVTVNDADPAKRESRLALLARMRDAVHRVADFGKIEG